MSARIAILGGGAIGGYVAAGLASSGHDVVLIDPWPAHVEAIRANGLRVTRFGEAQDRLQRLRCLHVGEVQALGREARFDAVLIALKAYDTLWACHLAAPLLAADGVAVSVQNGINEPVLQQVFGARTLGCVVMIAAELVAPGHVVRSMGPQRPPRVEFRVGAPAGADDRAERLALLFGAFDGAGTTDDLGGERWSKLCLNAMHNGVSALTGLNGSDREADPAIRRFEIRLGQEAVAVGRAAGFTLDSVGAVPAGVLAACLDGDAAAFARADDYLLAGTLGGKRGPGQRPSLSQDIAKGRRTEVDFLNGEVVRRGHALGIPTPANAAVVALIGQLERGEIAAHPDVIRQREVLSHA